MPDPRTSQFTEVAIFTGISLLVHLMVLLGSSSLTLISIAYLFFAGIGLPLTAIVVSLILKNQKKWHWGQVLLASFVSLILGFLQVVVVASALSSV